MHYIPLNPHAASQRDVAVHLQVLPSLEEAQATVMNKLQVLEGLTRSLVERTSATATMDEEQRRDLLGELPFTENEGMPQSLALHTCCSDRPLYLRVPGETARCAAFFACKERTQALRIHADVVLNAKSNRRFLHDLLCLVFTPVFR